MQTEIRETSSGFAASSLTQVVLNVWQKVVTRRMG
jgi:hypothetical protein